MTAAFGKIGTVLVALGSILTACTTLPKTPHTQDSLWLDQQVSQRQTTLTIKPTHTSLIHAISTQTQRYPTLSGYYPIATGANAFAARSILSDMANQSIDVQYYIWHNDEAGQLMLKDLWEAAERGVLVRLLIDDMNSSSDLDNVLVNFAKHPNIAVRLVNPTAYRKWRGLGLVASPARMNRRMHNKSMTFDGQISIIGGRNIGNEYLNNDKTSSFADLDVLLVGTVVPSISQSFDDYWHSSLAFDIETLVSPKALNLERTFAYADHTKQQQASHNAKALRTYREAVTSSTIGQDLLNHNIPFRWTRVVFVADDADKLTGNLPQERTLIHQLQTQFGTPKTAFSIISSYFVPTKAGTKGLIRLAKQGVSVQILTNSYDATDVGLVHTGYAHHRKALLQAGVRLFELKATAKNPNENNKLSRTKGQSTTSLHAKAFAVDNHKVFIGSYNVDPRSANLNSEMGVIIYDDQLANQLHKAFNDHLLHHAYEVKLNKGNLEWHSLENDKPVIFDKEPNVKLDDKLGIFLLSKLPLDGLL